jgi:hypothetical protein
MTHIEVTRFAFRDTYTIGRMFVDGHYFCDTLEDTVRPDGVKIKGKTAIPAGTYKGGISYSPKFKKNLPYIENVPMFDGIRIHTGNTAIDTEGCILVGYNKVVGKVIDSTVAFTKLFQYLVENSSDFEITIS